MRPNAAILAIATLLPTGSASAQPLTLVSGVDPVLVVDSSRGVSWVDVDGDGDLDLYVTNGGSQGERNEFYRNDAGTLVRDTSSVLTNDFLRDDGVTWGDYDNDGDPDVFVASWYGENNGLFENLGGGSFAKITTGNPLVTTSSYSEGCSWVDYDLDHDLDLYVANSGSSVGACPDNLLFRNDGGTFVRITSGVLVEDDSRTRQPAWADYDNDGDPDLFLANELDQNNRLFRNLMVETGSPTFEEVDAGPVTSDGSDSWSASWADFDNDGDLDLYVATNSNDENYFYRNQLTETGSATFTQIIDMDLGSPGARTGWGTGSAWGDWDNDGDLDLVHTNGYSVGQPSVLRRNWYFRNDDGFMNRISLAAGSPPELAWSYGASWGDYDTDGDLDLYIANWFGNGEANFFYTNGSETNGNHWLQVDLTGTVSNRSGIGARITVQATIDGESVSQIREVAGSNGHCSHRLRAHFGLGDAAMVESLTVRWPSGIVQELHDVVVDQVLEIVEEEVVATGPQLLASGPSLTATPNPFGLTTTLRYRLERPTTAMITIYDVRGRRVRRLMGDAPQAGWQEVPWDGADDAGRPAASGTYYGRLWTGAHAELGPAVRISLVR